MHDERTGTPREGEPTTSVDDVTDLGQADRDVQCLVLNLVARHDQRPWSIEEIARVMSGSGSRIAIEDAITQLRDVGLLNQADRLIFASQASAHIDRLGMLVL
jgi:hypothetical protein